MKQLAYRTTFVLLLLLAGCAQLGLPTADTFNQRLAVGYGTVTTIRTTATTLLTAKKIDATDAQSVQNGADAARQGLDVARTLNVSNPTAANDKLTAATTALHALQSYLSSRSK